MVDDGRAYQSSLGGKCWDRGLAFPKPLLETLERWGFLAYKGG
jgi:hypothetical protein